MAYDPAVLSGPQSNALDPKTIASLYPCNEVLVEKLRETDPTKANNLACVRLSVPKENVVGRTIGGPSTYAGDYSRFVRVTP